MFRIRNRVTAEPPARFTYQQQKDRAADELVGICRGVLADGAVTAQEAGFLRDWIERNSQYASSYPFDHLYRRLLTALTDGVLDQEEEADLLDTLVALTGGEADLPGRASLSTSLPLCSPPPDLVFPGTNYVVTGTFVYGSRAEVVRAIEDRGALVKAAVSAKVDILVIGEVGSQAWKHSSYGRKIEKAVELRESGCGIRIVSEPHWGSFLS